MNWDLIIFDCDGILVDSEQISSRVIAEEFTKRGVALTTIEAAELFTGGSLADTFDYFKDQTGKELSSDFEAIYRQRSFEAFEKELRAVEGIESVLKKLPIPFCVASNGPINKMELNLQLVGLLPYFKDKMFSAYQLKAWKPDPKLFLHAAKKMDIPAYRCLVIEDSMHGVHAAISAGMEVMAYVPHGDGGKFKKAGATVFKSMYGLPKLLGI